MAECCWCLQLQKIEEPEKKKYVKKYDKCIDSGHTHNIKKKCEICCIDSCHPTVKSKIVSRWGESKAKNMLKIREV